MLFETVWVSIKFLQLLKARRHKGQSSCKMYDELEFQQYVVKLVTILCHTWFTPSTACVLIWDLNAIDCCKRWLLFAERFNDSLFSLTVDESPFLAANYGCKMDICTVFENHRKSLIQRCEPSEQCLHFERTKVD